MADESERKRLNVTNPNSARDHQSLIEKQIREAMERGDFDNLRGAGKPQNLARDPNVPEDWELAFNLLKNAGFAPDWIETRKEVDTAREKLFAPLQRFLQTPPSNQTEFAQQQTKLVQNFRAQAVELNRLIDIYNLKAPTSQVHLRRVRVEYEIEKFLSESQK
ncbi:MAG: DUF1992 domain-containing protein [Chloroflexota bacterium]|nr:MAG: DUF1992 domain-containing protein [Chloroflexota bacterium]